jgi:hypothetical protein
VDASGFLGDRGNEPEPPFGGELADGDALTVDFDLDVPYFSFVRAGLDEVDEFLRQVDGPAGELDDGENLGQPDVRLFGLDLDRSYAIDALKVGPELGGSLRRVSSGLGMR